ncbi:unnamed protein product, partial [Staurois parvus]
MPSSVASQCPAVMPVVPPNSAVYQYPSSVPPISATYQCCLSVPPIHDTSLVLPISARLSVPFSAAYQCCLSVPISAAYKCPSV